MYKDRSKHRADNRATNERESTIFTNKIVGRKVKMYLLLTNNNSKL